MELDYSKKDIKKSAKVKQVKENVVFEENGIYKFIVNGMAHAYGTKEEAEKLLKEKLND
jgi:hypothetical protein